jgi:hypothetical protein
LGSKTGNDGNKRTPKIDESQDYRNCDCFVVVADSFYPEQAGGGHEGALSHDYNAVSPAVDSYFHSGCCCGAFDSQPHAAGASQAPVAGRQAIVRTCGGPGDGDLRLCDHQV